jgi:hypothetical protein
MRLNAVLRVGGAVATLAGLDTVLRGPRSIAGRPQAGAAVDSELRFYSAFYVAFGLAMLRAATRADSEPETVTNLAGALFLAGVARAAAWRSSGAPHPAQKILLGIELGLPPLLAGAASRRSAS